MIPHECREFREKLDEHRAAGIAGEAGSRLDGHMESCPSCREFAHILGQISQGLEKAEPDPFLERRVYNAVLSESRPAPKPVPRRWVWIAVPPAAIACIVAVLLWPSAPQSDSRENRRPAIAERPGLSQNKEITPSASEIQAEIAKTADGRRFIEVFDGTALWLDRGADVAVEALGTDLARFTLKRGRVVAEIGPHAPGFRFLVTTPTGEVEAKGTVFAVEVNRDGAERVRVLRGTVEVRTRSGARGQLLNAGQTMLIGDTGFQVATDEDIARDRCLLEPCDEAVPNKGKPGRAKSASDLAELARQYRRDKKYKQASKTYQRLIATYPKSDTALRGTVALAMMELDILGHTDDALGHFNAYLEQAPSGPLAEASYIGRVRALSRANRQQAVLKAIRQYLKRYPSSNVTPEMLRRQGDALAKLGRCKEAMGVYRRIVEGWPESRDADRAKAGLVNCGTSPSDT
jgi:ferric-dicitrate binding protein FerR (iron transport regulator)